VERFAEDPGFLSHDVRFDLPRLGTVSGQRGVHLQRHIGTDTVSLARLGASMTGLDFSAPAVEQARLLAARAGANARLCRPRSTPPWTCSAAAGSTWYTPGLAPSHTPGRPAGNVVFDNAVERRCAG
jgi:hypothetical protein